jgi:hypothetical protein
LWIGRIFGEGRRDDANAFLEHEQTGPILEALNDLGLVNVPNINYPLGLKRALGLGDIRNSNQQGAARA